MPSLDIRCLTMFVDYGVTLPFSGCILKRRGSSEPKREDSARSRNGLVDKQDSSTCFRTVSFALESLLQVFVEAQLRFETGVTA
ncbi:hypothetical protein COCOBI_12-1820 [Coccomyxa sp. Obi]|nr:hypothetical protein COCOBI_12-1820 [Coccomyxa sp. Obi]